jgi:hypothetical protein
MENLTTEQIEKSISAAYDSVNLINDLSSKESLDEEQLATISRNKEHLVIMLGKDWFLNALTTAQKKELEKLSK